MVKKLRQKCHLNGCFFFFFKNVNKTYPIYVITIVVLAGRKENMHVRNPEETDSLGFRNIDIKREDIIRH